MKTSTTNKTYGEAGNFARWKIYYGQSKTHILGKIQFSHGQSWKHIRGQSMKKQAGPKYGNTCEAKIGKT